MVAASDLALLDPDELHVRLGEARRELFNLRFQLATGQLDNTSRLRVVRRDVARILTFMREREIAEVEEALAAGAAERPEGTEGGARGDAEAAGPGVGDEQEEA